MSTNQMIELFSKGVLDTLIMTLVAGFVSFLLGGLLGIWMTLVKKGGLKENLTLYSILDTSVNLIRSVPFVILMLFLMPLTKFVVRTTIGILPTTLVLIISAIPYIGRLVENVLSEVDGNLIEMAQSLGASTTDILKEVILKESWPVLLKTGGVALVTILSYGAMAGIVGGGGLGVIAINYGYYRNQTLIMFIAIVLLVIIVQLIEWITSRWALKINRKN